MTATGDVSYVRADDLLAEPVPPPRTPIGGLGRRRHVTGARVDQHRRRSQVQLEHSHLVLDYLETEGVRVERASCRQVVDGESGERGSGQIDGRHVRIIVLSHQPWADIRVAWLP